MPAIGMRAETIVRLAPDLVLVDSFAPANFKRLLRAARIAVVEFDEASGVEATAIQMAGVGRALGVESAGAAMADAFRVDVAGLTRNPSARAPLAAIFQANGMTLGLGTQSDDLLRRAGWRNLAAERGLESFVALPLEAVVSARPDLLVLEGDTSERPSRAESLMNHRALRAARSTATLAMPHHLWLCGGPQNVEALRRLAAARERIAR